MLDYSTEADSKSFLGKVAKKVIPLIKQLPKPTICVKF